LFPTADEATLAWAWEMACRPPTGAINCLALSAKGEMSGVTTTSGLAWKIPGRVGDSPIIGAGLYVDQDVGAAGSTGRGEENIRVAGTYDRGEYASWNVSEGGVPRRPQASGAQFQQRYVEAGSVRFYAHAAQPSDGSQ
jgi:hypothetical protein